MATTTICSQHLFSWFLWWCFFAVFLVPILTETMKLFIVSRRIALNRKNVRLYIPSWNIFWSIALFRCIVVDLTGRATEWAFVNAVQAHVEFLAVSFMWVFWMDNSLALGIGTFSALGWAAESICISLSSC